VVFVICVSIVLYARSDFSSRPIKQKPVEKLQRPENPFPGVIFLEDVAKQLSCHYEHQCDLDIIKNINKIMLFNGATNGQISIHSRLYGEKGKTSWSIFEYVFRWTNLPPHITEGRKADIPIERSVCLIENEQVFFPRFIIEPETFNLEKMYEDIDIDENPMFSKLYFLKSPEAENIKSFFKKEFLDYLVANKGLAIEAYENSLFIYYPKHVLDLKDIPEFYEKCFEIYNLLNAPSGKLN